ncbi:MAG: ROK family protein [Acidobacteriota bacterium]
MNLPNTLPDSGAKTRAIFAVELGGTHATVALVGERRLLAKEELTLPSTKMLSPVLPSIASHLERWRETADLVGFALGFCGLVDSVNHRVLSTNGKYEDAVDLDLPTWSQQQFGLPLRLENDVRMALLGEAIAGAARHETDVVLLTLGTGIGSAVMMNGELLRGKHGQAGNLCGHIAVGRERRTCNCGNVGCAESEASGWGLPAVSRDWPGFAASGLAKGAVNFERLFQLAESGDRVSIEIRDRCLDIWADTALAAAHSFGPELILVGGGVMRSGNIILDKIASRLQQAWTPWGRVRVAAAALGEDAALYGALRMFNTEIQ